MLAKDFKNLDVNRMLVLLVEMTDRLLGAFSPKPRPTASGSSSCEGSMSASGVPITSFVPGEVHPDDGSVIAARTVVWAAGVKANPLAPSLGLPRTERGEISVTDELSVPGHPDRWPSRAPSTWPAASTGGCEGSRPSRSAT